MSANSRASLNLLTEPSSLSMTVDASAALAACLACDSGGKSTKTSVRTRTQGCVDMKVRRGELDPSDNGDSCYRARIGARCRTSFLSAGPPICETQWYPWGSIANPFAALHQDGRPGQSPSRIASGEQIGLWRSHRP
jgi:hypothetical protein